MPLIASSETYLPSLRPNNVSRVRYNLKMDKNRSLASRVSVSYSMSKEDKPSYLFHVFNVFITFLLRCIISYQ
jgi:hypothetical protein